MTPCSVMGGYKSFHRQGTGTNRGYSSDTLVILLPQCTVLKDRKPQLQKYLTFIRMS